MKTALFMAVVLFVLILSIPYAFYHNSNLRFKHIEKLKYQGSYKKTSQDEIYKSLSDYYSMISLGNYKEGVNERWPKTAEKLEFEMNVDDITLRVEKTTKNKGDKFIVNYEYYIDVETEWFLQPNILIKMKFKDAESLGFNSPSQIKEIQVAANYRMTFDQEIDKKTYDKLLELKNKNPNKVSIKSIFSSNVRWVYPLLREGEYKDVYSDSEILSVRPSTSLLDDLGKFINEKAVDIFIEQYEPWLNTKLSSDSECSEFKVSGRNGYLSFNREDKYSWTEFKSKTRNCLKKFSGEFTYPDLGEVGIVWVRIPIVVYKIEDISLISKIGTVGSSYR